MSDRVYAAKMLQTVWIAIVIVSCATIEDTIRDIAGELIRVAAQEIAERIESSSEGMMFDSSVRALREEHLEDEKLQEELVVQVNLMLGAELAIGGDYVSSYVVLTLTGRHEAKELMGLLRQRMTSAELAEAQMRLK